MIIPNDWQLDFQFYTYPKGENGALLRIPKSIVYNYTSMTDSQSGRKLA